MWIDKLQLLDFMAWWLLATRFKNIPQGNFIAITVS